VVEDRLGRLNITISNHLMIYIKEVYMQTKEVLKLMQENARLRSETVFLTKQVTDRDKLIQRLQELANLGIKETNYEIDV